MPVINRIKREASWLYRQMFNPSASSEGEVDKKEIRSHLPRRPTVVEAGAYKGLDTEEMSRLWPDATIHAFEPIPGLFQQVIDRVGFRSNVRCYNLALGAHSGTTTLHVSSGASDASSSILRPKKHLEYHPETTFGEAIEVQVVTLSEWMSRNNVDNIDFLWLDLQGAEFEVLKSSAEILRNVTAIYTEVCLVEQYEGAVLYPDVRKWLEERGFRVAREKLPWEDAGNVLFVNDTRMS